jgi:hypothetical protein
MEVENMYINIHEAVVEGSDTILLAIPEKDYFLSYESLTIESAQDLVENYFKYRGRDGVPTVTDVDFNSNTRSVKITVDMRYDREFKMLPLDIAHSIADGEEK